MQRRDYILVPILSVSTIIALFALAELGTRITWSAHEDDHNCVLKDSSGVVRGKPDCTVRSKVAEGPWVTYQFNACGYRTDATCGPMVPGALRIALLGSSIAEGLNVPENETFADRTARALTNATGRDVQIENMGIEGISVLQCYRKLDEALALKPNLLIYAISPFDLEPRMNAAQLANRNSPNQTFTDQKDQFARIRVIQVALLESRALLIAQHFLFADPGTYLRLYLNRGDQAGYLRQPFSGTWKARFADFDLVLADMASRSRQAGIPLLVLVVPSRSQAALLSVGQRPPQTDPFAFGRAIQQLAAKHQVDTLDTTSAFDVPHAEKLFYTVDAHITGEGHALVASALAAKCLDSHLLHIPAAHQ